MKTTRDTSLVVFVSFILIARLARCGAATILDDREKEAEELEQLVRKEVLTSLQLLGKEDNEGDVEPYVYSSGNGNRNRVTSTRYQNPGNDLLTTASGNAYETPEYSSYYGGNSKPNGYSTSSGNYRYSAPAQDATKNCSGSKTGRSINASPSSSVSTMNTREPDEYTTTITLPALSGGRLLYGGSGGGSYSGGGGYTGSSGYSGGGGYGLNGGYGGIGGSGLRFRPNGLIRRGINRLGRLGGQFAGGSGLRYGLGSGVAGLLGGAGLQGLRYGFGGGSGGSGAGGEYYGNGMDSSVSVGGGGGGRRRYYGNGQYGLQGDYDSSGAGRSWSSGGGTLGDYYNLRYGSPSSSAATVSLDGDASRGRSDRCYAMSSYSGDDASSATTTTTDEEAPTQYELMFLKDQANASENILNRDSDAKVTATSTGSGGGTSGGSGYRVNLSGTGGGRRRRENSASPVGVEEYRVVVVNNDSAGGGSSRSGVSFSGSGSAPGGSSSSSWSVSSNGSGESSSARNGFKITTPITSTQVTIPPTSIVGSVLSSVQGAATGDQARSLGSGGDSSGGKIIQLIKTSQ